MQSNSLNPLTKFDDEQYFVLKALYLEYFVKVEKESEALKNENAELKGKLEMLSYCCIPNVTIEKCNICNRIGIFDPNNNTKVDKKLRIWSCFTCNKYYCYDCGSYFYYLWCNKCN